MSRISVEQSDTLIRMSTWQSRMELRNWHTSRTILFLSYDLSQWFHSLRLTGQSHSPLGRKSLLYKLSLQRTKILQRPLPSQLSVSQKSSRESILTKCLILLSTMKLWKCSANTGKDSHTAKAERTSIFRWLKTRTKSSTVSRTSTSQVWRDRSNKRMPTFTITQSISYR